MPGRMVYLVDTPPAADFELWSDYPDVMNAKQAAEALQVSMPTMRRLITSQALRVVRIGRAVRVTKTALLEFIQEGSESIE